jgi:hypothetical protein
VICAESKLAHFKQVLLSICIWIIFKITSSIILSILDNRLNYVRFGGGEFRILSWDLLPSRVRENMKAECIYCLILLNATILS